MQEDVTVYIQVYLKSGEMVYSVVWRDDYEELVNAFSKRSIKNLWKTLTIANVDGSRFTIKLRDIRFITQSKDTVTEDEDYDEDEQIAR